MFKTPMTLVMSEEIECSFESIVNDDLFIKHSVSPINLKFTSKAPIVKQKISDFIHSDDSRLKTLAWLGDARLELELRMLTLCMIPEKPSVILNEFKTNETMKTYLASVDGNFLMKNGHRKAHFFGSVFELLYYIDGDFRNNYWRSMLGTKCIKICGKIDIDSEQDTGLAENMAGAETDSVLANLTEEVQSSTLDNNTSTSNANGAKFHNEPGNECLCKELRKLMSLQVSSINGNLMYGKVKSLFTVKVITVREDGLIHVIANEKGQKFNEVLENNQWSLFKLC